MRIVVEQKDNESIELMLNFGGIPGERISAGQTILHDLYRLTDSIVQRLVERGADPNARDSSGATPLDHAVRQSNNVKFLSLYRLGGIQGAESAPPLTEAASRYDFELVHFLLGIGSFSCVNLLNRRKNAQVTQ